MSKHATEFLGEAQARMEERAKEYDQPGGERNMLRIVTAFNAITGHSLTEAEGWQFMQTLKDVRLFSANNFHQDSAEDGIAFASLKAEAKSKQSALPLKE